MTERIFRAGYVEMFNEAHPAAEGWKVYQHDTHSKVPLWELENFITKKHPEWATRMEIMRVVSQAAEDAGAAEVDYRGWVGAIELLVDGKELHFRRYNDGYHNSLWIADECLALAATKDEEALTRLYSELVKFALEEEDSKANVLTLNRKNFKKPELTWDDLILPGEMAKDLRQNLEAFFAAGPRYKEFNLPYKRGYIFAGPPGTGKTLSAKIVSSIKHISFIFAPHSQLDRPDKVIEAFAQAKKHAPAVLLLEDLDRVAALDPILTQVLNSMDDFVVSEGVLVITTVNDINRLDPALVNRPSRFDRIWKFPLPGQPERLALLTRLGKKHFSEAALAKTAAETDGFSMAYVQEVFTNALLLAVGAGQEVSDAHLEQSLAVLKKQFKDTGAKAGLKESKSGNDGVGFKP
jgi:hypothetical protein